MGFKLDQSTINDLAAVIALEVVKAIRDEASSKKSLATPTIVEHELIEAGSIKVDLGRREATVRGRVLPLKPRELECLTALARNAGRALTREQLLELAWDDAALDRIESERTVDVHIRRLRLHLGDDAHLLRTVARVGYRLDPG